MSIRSKTLLIFLVVLSLLLALILPYAINRTNKLRDLYLEDLAGRFEDEVDRAVSSKKDVWLTNALQIAKNPIIIDSLARGDREPAIQLLAEYSSDFKEYTNFKNVVVHLIDGENRSFVKSWDSGQFGESLSYSRAYPMFLNSGTPFVTMEESPKGLRLKGLFPVMKDNSLIGIVNYEGGLNSIKRDMEEKNLEFLYVLDESYLPIAASLQESPSVQGYRVSQKDINQDFVDFCAAECDLDKAVSSYFFNEHYVVKAIPILHENGEELGYYFMGQKTDMALEDFQVNMRFTLVIFLGMGLAIVVLLAVFMVFLEINIVKPVRNFSDAFSQIAMGDLEQDINVSEKTYLGTLASSGKGMVESLRKFINGIQGSTQSIEKTFKIMVDVMNTSITEANSIAYETNQTLNEVNHLGDSTARADSSVGMAESEIRTLQNRVEDQTSAISQTTSAIAQMTASIENIARIAESRLSSAKGLLRFTDEGSDQVKQTMSLIGEIGSSIESMQELATIISEITEQTNLLAMNAAIEAAHAGEQGKGFAVVAGEIRSLAESTSKSSIQITQTLKILSEKIHTAVEAGEKTESAFNTISHSSREVTSAFESISMSTSELNVGSEEMMKAASLLQDVARDVDQSTKEIGESLRNINNTMEDVTRTSERVKKQVHTVREGTKELTLSMKNISDATINNNETLSRVLSEMNDFHISRENDLQQKEIRERLDQEKLILQHTRWVTVARSYLDGTVDLDLNNLLDHKQCDMGKWLAVESNRSKLSAEDFRRVDEAHVGLHDLMREIVRDKTSGKAIDLEAEFMKLAGFSQIISATLGRMGSSS